MWMSKPNCQKMCHSSTKLASLQHVVFNTSLVRYTLGDTFKVRGFGEVLKSKANEALSP